MELTTNGIFCSSQAHGLCSRGFVSMSLPAYKSFFRMLCGTFSSFFFWGENTALWALLSRNLLFVIISSILFASKNIKTFLCVPLVCTFHGYTLKFYSAVSKYFMDFVQISGSVKLTLLKNYLINFHGEISRRPPPYFGESCTLPG